MKWAGTTVARALALCSLFHTYPGSHSKGLEAFRQKRHGLIYIKKILWLTCGGSLRRPYFLSCAIFCDRNRGGKLFGEEKNPNS